MCIIFQKFNWENQLKTCIIAPDSPIEPISWKTQYSEVIIYTYQQMEHYKRTLFVSYIISLFTGTWFSFCTAWFRLLPYSTTKYYSDKKKKNGSHPIEDAQKIIQQCQDFILQLYDATCKSNESEKVNNKWKINCTPSINSLTLLSN